MTHHLIVTKCCGRAKHTSKCVAYWHARQREEVRARVAVEKQLDKAMLASESKEALAKEWQGAAVAAMARCVDLAHELAVAMEARRVWCGETCAGMSRNGWGKWPL